MRIKDVLQNSPLSFSATPRLDLELLLEKALNKSKEFIYSNPDYKFTSEQSEQFKFLLKRREKGEPVAYILGSKDFWTQNFIVNDKVLIPRPETELLIEIALDRIKKEEASIVDLGTGSGVIALSLAKEKPSWNIVATDISADALQIASYNAMQLDVKNIEFYCGDWCSVLPNKKFDLIISNPPYIKKDDPHLKKEDLVFEPSLALEAGDGLDAIRKISIQAKDNLQDGGLLVLEHGYDQKKKVVNLLQGNGYSDIVTHQDLAGLDRAIVATYCGPAEF